jgi:hypothetical protein
MFALAVLTAFAVQLSVLSADASADDSSPVATAQDELAATPAAQDDGTVSESPAADPVPDPGTIPPEPGPRAGQPATVESPEPEAADPGLPPPDLDSPDVTDVSEEQGPAEPSPVPTREIEGSMPTIPEPVAPPPPPAASPVTAPLPLVAQEPPARPRAVAAKRSPASMGVAPVAWGRPSSLVSGVTVRAWGAAVQWRPPPVSLPAARDAKPPTAATTQHQVRQTPPEHPPHVPRAPSRSLCGGASSCGSASLAMLPLFAAIVCLCALLFERLIEAPALWRPARFVSLRERPG